MRFHRATAIALMAVFLVGLASAVPSAEAGKSKTTAPIVPCSDPRGCPDLIVDQADLNQWHVEERTFDADDCSVVEGYTQIGTRRLLRFTYTTPNIGPGDLVIGARADHPEWFDEAICHGHPHFKEYADYRLWTPQGFERWQALRAKFPNAIPRELLAKNPDVATHMVAGAKLGFCVIDIFPAVPLMAPPPPPKYVSCRSNQGISVGYADSYHFLLDGQWIDVTNVKPGTYVLEAEVNPEQFFGEASYRNNDAHITIDIPARVGRTP